MVYTESESVVERCHSVELVRATLIRTTALASIVLASATSRGNGTVHAKGSVAEHFIIYYACS